METIAIIIFGVGCFALGMYVTTQISSWIDNRIQHKKLSDMAEKNNWSDIIKIWQKIRFLYIVMSTIFIL